MNMISLNKNWLTEGHVDFEYKKYMLLAYLQKVRHCFDKSELYPPLADLVAHYRNLQDIRKNKSSIYSAFPDSLEEASIKRLRLSYRKKVKDGDVMKEIDDILEYAIPKLRTALEEGKEIYDHVESFCNISPIGLRPLYMDEGYVFIEQPPKKETKIYRYQLTLVNEAEHKSRSLYIRHIETSSRSIVDTYGAQKLSLVKRFKDLPNPATFLVSSTLCFPFKATIMPIAKRMLLKQLVTDE